MHTWCTKRSSPPSAGVTKPKPFVALNHLTASLVPLRLLIAQMLTGLRKAHGASRQGLSQLEAPSDKRQAATGQSTQLLPGNGTLSPVQLTAIKIE